ncbi:hypothetical protein OESDEN_16509 [Oesophagostomum dentatum]|uniref:Uncharacterized protein n=1 Tax=Oesophagostomum dentatum TaxID=61180 RepID=A0A0B1SEP5_OESDE|nr:hypothetical protein OESDEN_16509 [Oesophagostomum dentatum]
MFLFKDFLSVMGLSTPIFYLSHVLFAALKCLIVLMICSIPISTVLGPVNVSLFLVIMILYGLSTVTFAAMVSSCSRTPNTVLKVVIVLWVVLVGLPIKAPKVDEIFPCVLFSLNPNAAFSYALKGIADYMNRAALMIDFFFSDQDFTLFKLPFRNNYLASSGTRLDDVEGNNETDEGLLHTRAGISVHRLIKVWSSTNERAVDEMSMEAYVGQVTVLLGHNGAGKSTTFSVISGITAPTSGLLLMASI